MISTRSLVVALSLLAVFWGHRRWRVAVQAAVVLLVLEGALRKWVFPDAQDLVYFAKDLLLLGVYSGFLAQRRKGRMRLPALFTGMTIAAAVFGVLQVFNARLPNPLVGLLGFKAYFFYVPLAWVLPAVFDEPRALFSRLRGYLLLTLPIGLLSAAQFLSPAESAINAYARATGPAMSFGTSTHVRVTATFSYITGYTSYLLATVILVLALLAATRWRFRGNLDLYACLSLALAGMFMTGSRGPLFTITLLFPLYGWLSLAREGRRDAVVGRILLGVGLIAALVNQVGADAVGAFYGRASASTDVSERLLSPFLGPLYALEPSGLLGYGIGSSHQTAEAVTRGTEAYSWLEGNLIEDEPGRVMIELGPLGFVLVYFVRVYLVVLSLSQVFRLRTPFCRAMATSCALFFIAHLPGGVVFNVTADVYYWYFAGLLFCAMRLDRAQALPGVRRPDAAAAPALLSRDWKPRA